MIDAFLSPKNTPGGADLDDAHVGHIHSAFGAILSHDTGRRVGWRAG
jgi:hypothetical protein